jgi:hypothetical protein
MVPLTHDDGTMRILMERLLWPVRLVRWQVARQYGTLLSNKKTGDLALTIFLDWMSNRSLESEVVSALSILKCVPDGKLPPLTRVNSAINAPSILADVIVRQVYGYGHRCGGWSGAHSGEAPASFELPNYFMRNKGAQVPPIFWNTLSRISRVGIDLPKQWAFEWRSIMDQTKSPYSGFPHYFIDGAYRQRGVSGQFSQRQDDIFRSAFLRTVAFAVSKGMPIDYAHDLVCETLTLNNGLANVSPVARPAWLSNFPEQCCAQGANLETLVRDIIIAGSNADNQIPIYLRIPISPEVEKFGELQITAVLATLDFEGPAPDLDARGRNIWCLGESSALSGSLPEDDMAKCAFVGDKGDCVPLAMGLYVDPMGFWQHDYLRAGIALPMSFIVPETATVSCRAQSLDVEVDGVSVSRWSVWHDHYTPLHAPSGHPRCGTLTKIVPSLATTAAIKLGRKLAWVARLRLWRSETDYGELAMNEKSIIVFD